MTIMKISNFYNSMSSYYDKWMEEGESTLEDELSLVKLIFLQPCRILDVGCGTGRLALPLQECGYDIVGIDISEGMIAEAKNKGLLKTRVGDFSNFTDEIILFDGIISCHAGFSYINDSHTTEKSVKRIRELLKEGGTVLWDSPNEEHYGKERIMRWYNGEETIHSICYGHDVNDLTTIFEQQGLKICDVYGSYTPLMKFENDSPRIILVASKRRYKNGK